MKVRKTMAKSVISTQVMTPVFRVAFPNVFTPNEKNKYVVTMLFDKQNFNGAWLQEICKEVLSQIQASEFKGQPFPADVRLNPMKDGDVPNRNQKIHFPGTFFVNASTNFQPGVVDSYIDPSTNQLKVITDSRELYPGCYARAKIHAYWYNVDGNRGVGLSIGNIQKVKDGEQMGGGRPATQDFDAYDEQQVDYSGVPQYTVQGGAYAQPPAGMAPAPQPVYAQPQSQYVAPPVYPQPQPQYAQPVPQPNYAPQPQYNAPPVYPQQQPAYGPAPQQNIMDI